MDYFAEVNIENMVTRVVVAEANNLPPLEVNGDRWIQTYQDGTNGQYAGVGFFWNVEHSIFVEPQLYPSWTLNADNVWEAPVDKPDNTGYSTCVWYEEDQKWKATKNGVLYEHDGTSWNEVTE